MQQVQEVKQGECRHLLQHSQKHEDITFLKIVFYVKRISQE